MKRGRRKETLPTAESAKGVHHRVALLTMTLTQKGYHQERRRLTIYSCRNINAEGQTHLDLQELGYFRTGTVQKDQEQSRTEVKDTRCK